MNHCTGVIQGKLQALGKATPEEETKTLYQAVRILSETITLLKNSRFDVVFPDPELLISIRKGNVKK